MCESKCEKCNANVIVEYDSEDMPVYRCAYCGSVLDNDGEVCYGV